LLFWPLELEVDDDNDNDDDDNDDSEGAFRFLLIPLLMTCSSAFLRAARASAYEAESFAVGAVPVFTVAVPVVAVGADREVDEVTAWDCWDGWCI